MPEIKTTPDGSEVAVRKSAAALPFIRQFYMVQGINFRCLAYCDQQGIWHDAINQEELFGDLRILE